MRYLENYLGELLVCNLGAVRSLAAGVCVFVCAVLQPMSSDAEGNFLTRMVTVSFSRKCLSYLAMWFKPLSSASLYVHCK